jgi:UDP-N-acetylglucosamine:LPS N-acetylglucosamine transferase
MALVNKNAAIMVKDSDTGLLLAESQVVLSKKDQLIRLAQNIKQFARPSAADDIAQEVIKLAK